jgi:hypothetical protein
MTRSTSPASTLALEVVASRDADHLAGVLAGLDRACRQARRAALRRRVKHLLGEGVGFLVARSGGKPIGVLAYQWAHGALEVVYTCERPAKGALYRLLQAASQIGVSLGAHLVSVAHRPDAILPVPGPT